MNVKFKTEFNKFQLNLINLNLKIKFGETQIFRRRIARWAIKI